jgi:hypothetical protein
MRLLEQLLVRRIGCFLVLAERIVELQVYAAAQPELHPCVALQAAANLQMTSTDTNLLVE